MKRMVWCLILCFHVSVYAMKDVKAMFEECANCHGNNAQERALGKSKIIAHLSKEEIYEALKAYQDGVKDESGMGSIMESQVYGLSQEDMRNLADYIVNLNK